MVELVDTLVLEASVERRAGSSPVLGTKCRIMSKSVEMEGLAAHEIAAKAAMAASLTAFFSSSVESLFNLAFAAVALNLPQAIQAF